MSKSLESFFVVQDPFLVGGSLKVDSATATKNENDFNSNANSGSSSDHVFMVQEFEGTDAINRGFEVKVTITVLSNKTTLEHTLDKKFGSDINRFSTFLVKNKPSCLFHMQYTDENRSEIFFNRYEGVVSSAKLTNLLASNNGLVDEATIEITLIPKFNTLDRIRKSYLYINETKNITVANTKYNFLDSLSGTRGVMLEDVLISVLDDNQFADGIDYKINFTNLIELNQVIIQPLALVGSTSGVQASPNFLVHSKRIDKDLLRLTSKVRMRTQYKETDFNFINRLCESEGISILYEIEKLTVVTQELVALDSAHSKSATHMFLKTKYSIDLTGGINKEELEVGEIIPNPSTTNEVYLFPVGFIVYRAIMIITDISNRITTHLSPMGSDKRDSNPEWKIFNTMVRKPGVANEVDSKNISIRECFNIKRKNNTFVESVAVACYSEYSDNVAETPAHSPLVSTARNVYVYDGASKKIGSRIIVGEEMPAEKQVIGKGAKYYYGETIESMADANRIAVRRMEMLKCHNHSSTATTQALDAKAGAMMTFIDKNYKMGTDGTVIATLCYIFKTKFKGYNPIIFNDASGARDVPTYPMFSNEIEFIDTYKDHSLVFRPELVTPRPEMSTIKGYISAESSIKENSIVDGEVKIGDNKVEHTYADIDQYGRYVVNFIFDKSSNTARSKGNYSMGVRLRKASFYADGLSDAGIHFPLALNSEVLVGFNYGNPDMPYIAGSLFPAFDKNTSTAEDVPVIRKMMKEKQMSYIRSKAGQGIYLIDKKEESRVVMETDIGSKLDAITDISAVKFSGNNYIELGNQKDDDNGIKFGIRSGTSGFHKLDARGGMHIVQMTKPKYKEISEGIDTELLQDSMTKLKDSEKTSNRSFNVDYELSNLTEEQIEENLFTFYTYATPFSDAQLNTSMNNIAQKLPKETLHMNNTRPTTEDSSGNAVPMLDHIKEYFAPGSFTRTIGDEFKYRKGDDYIYVDTKDRSKTFNHFGNDVVEFYPSSDSTILTEEQQQGKDAKYLPKFDHGKYIETDAEAKDGTKNAKSVHRYFGNRMELIEGSYVEKNMANKFTKIIGKSYFFFMAGLTIKTKDNINIKAYSINFKINNEGSVSVFSETNKSGGNNSNTYRIQTFAPADLTIGLNMRVVFGASINRINPISAEINIIGDFRDWGFGMSVRTRGARTSNGCAGNTVSMVNWGHFNEFLSGGSKAGSEFKTDLAGFFDKTKKGIGWKETYGDMKKSFLSAFN